MDWGHILLVVFWIASQKNRIPEDRDPVGE
jgi:hypothetical protein